MAQLTNRRPTSGRPSARWHGAPLTSSGGLIALWFGVSAIAAVCLLLLQSASGIDPEVVALVMCAPAIGAAGCWLVARDRLSLDVSRVTTGRFVRTSFVAVGVVAIYFLVVALITGTTPHLPWTASGTPIAVVLLLQFAGALGEEIGFRGLLFHTLAARVRPPAAALITGAAFGLWHIQYFGAPVLDHLVFLIGTIALTFTMVQLMVGSFWQRMVVCTILHFGMNLALASSGDDRSGLFALGVAALAGCAAGTAWMRWRGTRSAQPWVLLPARREPTLRVVRAVDSAPVDGAVQPGSSDQR